MISNLSVLKTRLFYFASIVSLLGHIIDAVFIENDNIEFFFNVATIAVTAIMIMLVRLKHLTSTLGNAVIIYSIYINILLSIVFKASWNNIDPIFLQVCLVYGIIMLYAGFSLKKQHVFIIGITFIVFYVIIAFVSKGYFLMQNMPLIVLLLGAYLFGVNVIVSVLNSYSLKQSELIENLTKSNKLLKEQSEAMDTLNKTKDKILSVIGHDLKTPASSIMGFSDLIERQSEKLQSDLLMKYSKLIYQSANRLNIFLSQILDWARIQSGKRNLNLQVFDATEAISDAISLMHGTIYLKAIKIDANCTEIQRIKADRQMFATIVRNLLTNALKYTPNGGLITISSVKTEASYQFTIVDSGKGVSNEVLEKLFTDKMIESTPGTENEKGTGLGMAICSEYIRLHHGSIWAENILGNGAAFHFSIPLNL